MSKPETTDDLLWRLRVLADRPTRGKFWPDETLRDAAREIERLCNDNVALRSITNLGRRTCGKGTMNCIGAKLMRDAIEDLA